ncbi:MAG TPA: OmpA family protein, partial [Bacteroidales bacterium]|nr:OmpA family protein [Bacteroidales bacterium]
WRVERKPNRTYGSPSNLGPRVNTFGDERYPFISKDNVLYFASDGHPGFGGLDLFKATFEGGIWSNVQNMLRPFNSEKDDFGYVINPKDPQKGFISTNRLGAEGEDYIFYVQYLDEEPQVVVPEPEPEPEVVEVEVVEPVQKPDPVIEVVETKPVVEEPKIDLSIFPSSLAGQVLSTFNGTALGDVNIVLADAFTGTVVGRATSSGNGRFSITIPDSYRREGQEFEISMSKPDYNTRKFTANIMDLNEIAATGFSLTPIFKEADLNELSGIVIPYVGDDITPDGYNILDRVAAYLLANPNVVIKLNGHTDARGDRLNNLNISQRIAEKAEEYLLKKSVPDENIIPRGYGERYILNKCRRGKLCSDEEHLENRRVEVVVWRFLN